MSYDLGLDHENESDSYISAAIKELEETYHLVLLTDFFEESLILLKVRSFSQFIIIIMFWKSSFLIE